MRAIRWLTVGTVVLATFVGLHAPANAAQEFEIGGDVTGLFPGIARNLTTTVHNPFEVPLRVVSLSAVPGSASPGCSEEYLTVSTVAPDVVVGAYESAAVLLEVAMARSAPDACQGATFDLTFQGIAVAEQAGALASTGADLALLPTLGLVFGALGIVAVSATIHRRDRQARL